MSEEMEQQDEVFTEDDMAVIQQLENEDNETTEQPVDDSPDKEAPPAEVEVSDEIGDDLRERAKAYGLDASLFDGAEKLESQMRTMDQYWAERVRQQRQQQHPQQQGQQPQQPPPQPGQQPEPPALPFKLELDPNEYPQELIDAFNGALEQIHNHYSPMQQTIDQLNQYVQYQQTQVQEQMLRSELEQFSDAVVSLDHPSLFGDGSSNTTHQQMENVKRLYQEAEVLADSYRMRGMPLPSVKELVKRAERLAFADQVEAFHTRTRNARLAKQANQKLGSGKRSAEAFRSDGDWDGEPEDNPVLKKAWEEMLAAQGER